MDDSFSLMGRSDVYGRLSRTELEVDRIDLALKDLVAWYKQTRWTIQPEENDSRTNARSLLDCELRFLEHAEARSHASRPLIQDQAGVIWSELGREATPAALERRAERFLPAPYRL
jgi:hypothetical protein